jgi:hypothetical protein
VNQFVQDRNVVSSRASRIADFAALRSNASFPIVPLTNYKMEMKMLHRILERRQIICVALPELLISSANQTPGMSERNASTLYVCHTNMLLVSFEDQ